VRTIIVIGYGTGRNRETYPAHGLAVGAPPQAGVPGSFSPAPPSSGGEARPHLPARLTEKINRISASLRCITILMEAERAARLSRTGTIESPRCFHARPHPERILHQSWTRRTTPLRADEDVPHPGWFRVAGLITGDITQDLPTGADFRPDRGPPAFPEESRVSSSSHFSEEDGPVGTSCATDPSAPTKLSRPPAEPGRSRYANGKPSSPTRPCGANRRTELCRPPRKGWRPLVRFAARLLRLEPAALVPADGRRVLLLGHGKYLDLSVSLPLGGGPSSGCFLLVAFLLACSNE